MKKKTLLIAVAAIVLAVISACSVTVAWLTAEAGTVENTFTVGNITIDINETDNDDEDSDTKKNSYKIVPGATIKKDPTVTVNANSENCWVYVEIVNTVVVDGQEAATWKVNDAWVCIGTKTADDGSTTRLYKYSTIVPSATSDTELPAVFSQVTYEGAGITSKNIATVAEGQITARAYAHQSDNVSTNDADEAAAKWAGVTLN